jgi:hypothetical protein
MDLTREWYLNSRDIVRVGRSTKHASDSQQAHSGSIR